MILKSSATSAVQNSPSPTNSSYNEIINSLPSPPVSLTEFKSTSYDCDSTTEQFKSNKRASIQYLYKCNRRASTISSSSVGGKSFKSALSDTNKSITSNVSIPKMKTMFRRVSLFSSPTDEVSNLSIRTPEASNDDETNSGSTTLPSSINYNLEKEESILDHQPKSHPKNQRSVTFNNTTTVNEKSQTLIESENINTSNTKNKKKKKSSLTLEFRKLAGKFSSKQCNYLGLKFEEEKDYASAFKWYKNGAEADNPAAQYNAARLLSKGLGCATDLMQSAKLYALSAEKGDSNSMNNLACLYKKGKGVEKDLSKAFELYKKSSDLGNATGSFNLGYFYEKVRIGVLPFEFLFLKGIEKSVDFEKAIEYYAVAANQGHDHAQVNLACLYVQGRGCEVNYDFALRLFKKAAEQKNCHAFFNLGYMLQKELGLGENQNTAEAKKFFRLALKYGDERARVILKEMEIEDDIVLDQ
ncbi:hypothetical protein HK099_005303 [Clydaea vesicula]|uniref:Uncharacterized protein n=1 Tax=Clydaea vesicula TaxID=447962 RepID=A0AAD5U409_9FUNG|nr:hypothetical protein HK099_005303 [Clydaea vesicula]KAJ3383775.1 hypothetical protein HDU92_003933 [Lobulomyces angularis]